MACAVTAALTAAASVCADMAHTRSSANFAAEAKSALTCNNGVVVVNAVAPIFVSMASKGHSVKNAAVAQYVLMENSGTIAVSVAVMGSVNTTNLPTAVHCA